MTNKHPRKTGKIKLKPVTPSEAPVPQHVPEVQQEAAIPPPEKTFMQRMFS